VPLAAVEGRKRPATGALYQREAWYSTAMLALRLAIVLLSTFPSVQVGMTHDRALAALATDGLIVCDAMILKDPNPALGDATHGLVACRACPCEAQKASLLVWFNAKDRVSSVAVVQR